MLSWLRNIGPTELIILVLIVVILFGSGIAKRLGRVSGETVREVKKVKRSFTEAIEDESDTKGGGK